jgi:hypothetical protein
VSRKARIRAAAAAAVALAIGLLFATGVAPGTWALFNAETQNTNNAYAGGWIPAPSGLADSMSGSTTASLTWTSGYNATAGTPGNHVNGQQLQYADGGSAGSVSCGSYGNVGSVLAANAGSTTDGGGTIGDWWCYRVISQSDVTWTTTGAAFTALLALVPSSFSTCGTACGSNAGQVDPSDKITINYNQAISYSGAGTITVCVWKTPANSIVIGDTGCGSSGDAGTIGKITGLSIPNANRVFETSTASASGSALTIVLNTATNGSGSRTQVTGTGTFIPAGTTVTAAGNGGGTQCTVATTCTPSATVSF